jgi:hypothetical protein
VLRSADAELGEVVNGGLVLPHRTSVVPMARRVVVFDYDLPIAESLGRVSAGSALGVYVDDVPAGDQFRFRVTTQATPDDSMGEQLGTWLRFFIGSLGVTASVSGLAPTDVTSTLGRSGFGGRGFVLPRAVAGNRTTIRACPRDCSGADEALASSVVLEVRPEYSMLLGVEMSFDFGRVGVGLEDTTENRDATYVNAYVRPRYEAVGAAIGPEQLYRLETDPNLLAYLRFNVLLGVRFGQILPNQRDFFLGAGPTVLDGLGANTLRTWHVRVGFETADNVFITLGAGVGVEPIGYSSALPVIVGVPRGASAPTAPTLSTEDRVVVNFGVGLLFATELFGTAAAGVLDLLGGD